MWHEESLALGDIQAAHRIGKKGIVICKFVNRKFAKEGLYCRKNLKGKNLYGNNTKVYINNSFCDEFRYTNYLIRKAKSDVLIFRRKLRNGIKYFQKEDGDDFIEISHKNDLIRRNHLNESEYSFCDVVYIILYSL